MPDVENPPAQLIAAAAAAATAARSRAYAPYSNFTMGAAVMSADGDLVDGVLVENVSLGLAMCAERVALFTAVTRGLRPAVLAVCSKRTSGELTLPCGACLQVALELAGPDLTVVAVDPDGEREHAPLRTLLPRGPRRSSPDYDARAEEGTSGSGRGIATTGTVEGGSMIRGERSPRKGSD